MDNFFDELFGGSMFNNCFAMKEWEEKLNKLYWTDAKEYLRTLDDVKNKGYKVLRNSKGKHKIQIKH
jgi:hypothetical protein